jgi:hypothetical protein
LNKGLLVYSDLDHTFLHRADNGLAEVKRREEVLVGCSLILHPANDRIRSSGAECQDGLGIGTRFQEGRGARHHVVRIGARIHILIAKLYAERIGKTLAALVRSRVLVEVIDTDETPDARGFRLFARRLAGSYSAWPM